jgi:hypothetical protein
MILFLSAMAVAILLSYFWPQPPRTDTQRLLDHLGPEYDTSPAAQAARELKAEVAKERLRKYYECVQSTGGHPEVCR